MDTLIVRELSKDDGNCRVQSLGFRVQGSGFTDLRYLGLLGLYRSNGES